MIPFNITKMSVEVVKLKSMTQALGGSIRVLDEIELAITGEEKFNRVPCPMAVVRAFQKLYKKLTFFDPVDVAVTKYDGHVVALEMFPYALAKDKHEYRKFNDGTWYPTSQYHLNTALPENMVKSEYKDGTWFIDGKFVYWLPNDLNKAADDATLLSVDGKFRALSIDGFPLADIGTSSAFFQVQRHVLMFVTSTGEIMLTPPIWKDLEMIGVRAINRIGDVDNATKYPFDRIDNHLSVNLSFALRAATEISQVFDYEDIAPLQLPEMMIRLRTVNLPRVPKEVKQTFDIGLSFTHAIAWLIGLMKRTHTIEAHLRMRAVLKHLTTKGIYHDSMFDPHNVYMAGMEHANMVLKDADAALLDGRQTTISSTYLADMIASSRPTMLHDMGDDSD